MLPPSLPVKYFYDLGNALDMAKSGGSDTCDVTGCSDSSVKSISAKKVEDAGLELEEGAGKRAHLCKEHYKEYKKATKTDRALEHLGR